LKKAPVSVARLPEEKNNIKYKIEDGKRGKEI
jgi:hypothetical protein